MIRVGDTVTADFEDVGMSHRQRYVGPAVVTAVHPIPHVKPVGWSFDRPVRWSEIKSMPRAAGDEAASQDKPADGGGIAGAARSVRERIAARRERARRSSLSCRGAWHQDCRGFDDDGGPCACPCHQPDDDQASAPPDGGDDHAAAGAAGEAGPLELADSGLAGSPRAAAQVHVAGRCQTFDLPVWRDQDGQIRIALPKVAPQHSADTDQVVFDLGGLLAAIGKAVSE